MEEEEGIIWYTEKRLVKDLIPYKSNPRYITKHQLNHLKNSFKESGYVELIAVQPDNRIIAGHMRVRVMLSKGWKNKEIEVRVPERYLTLEEMRRYMIRSNKNVGDWDYDIMANEWEPIELFEAGFTEDQLNGIGKTKTKTDESTSKDICEGERCSSCGQKIRKKNFSN